MSSNNGSKHNGSGNGHDQDEPDKVVHFPTLADRDRIRKEKEAQDKAWREEYKKSRRPSEPFLKTGNIPPFTRYFSFMVAVLGVILLFVLEDKTRLEMFYIFGFVPGYFTGATDTFPLTGVFGPLTHTLIHSSWMHLIFNSIMMLAFGTLVEKNYGTRATLKIFVICTLTGAALFFLTAPFDTAPMVGASGAISGLFGVALMILYRDHQLGAIGKYGPWPIVAFWVALMLLFGVIGGGGIAWQAHIGGFLMGVLLAELMTKGRLRL